MAESKRKRAADSDSTQTKAPKRAHNLEPGKVEKHMQVVNTSTHSHRAFTRSTKRKDTEAARNGVFNTEELLEAILVFLPHLDIIKCQRVTHYWQDVINRSTQIKKKLFIRRPDDIESWTVQNRKTVATDGVPDVVRYASGRPNRWFDVMAITSQLNPLVSNWYPRQPTPEQRWDGTYGLPHEATVRLSREARDGFLQLLLGQDSPLLSQMLFTTLPVTNVSVHIQIKTAGGWRTHRNFDMKSTDTLTMGALAERAGRGQGYIGTIKAPGGIRVTAPSDTDFATAMRYIESRSRQKVEMDMVTVRIKGVFIASAAERAAVKAGKGDVAREH